MLRTGDEVGVIAEWMSSVEAFLYWIMACKLNELRGLSVLSEDHASRK